MMLLALMAAACLSVPGPNITARDLSRAVPAFTPTDPDTAVAYTPIPGVQRILHPSETRDILARLNFDGTPPLDDLCFQRTAAVITEDAVRAAMQKTLGADAQIEVEELSKFPAPVGELVFPREALGMPPVALWTGFVRYDGQKKFPVWARVKVSVKTKRVIALEELKPGSPIRASELSLETVEGFPDKRTTLASVEQTDGCTPRRYIAANSPVWTDAINPPNDINKGDRVTVLVRSGLAQLSFDAEADSAGRRGDFISFKNPESGKSFRAQVDGPDKALVKP